MAPRKRKQLEKVWARNSSSSSHFCAGQRLTPHNRALEVRPGRITKKLEHKLVLVNIYRLLLFILMLQIF